MKRANSDVVLYSMEPPGCVGDDLRDLYQVEEQDAVEVFSWHWGPGEGDEGGGEGASRGGRWCGCRD